MCTWTMTQVPCLTVCLPLPCNWLILALVSSGIVAVDELGDDRQTRHSKGGSCIALQCSAVQIAMLDAMFAGLHTHVQIVP